MSCEFLYFFILKTEFLDFHLLKKKRRCGKILVLSPVKLVIRHVS